VQALALRHGHGTGIAPVQCMGVLVIVVIPVTILIAVIVMTVWGNLSVGTVVIGMCVIAGILGLVSLLLRFTWRAEEDEGVHEETGERGHET
jgi:hypothetical protein